MKKRTRIACEIVKITSAIVFLVIIVLGLYPNKIYLYRIDNEIVKDNISLIKESKEAGKEKEYIVKSSWRDSLELSESDYIKWVKDYNTISINHKELEVVEVTYRFFGKMPTNKKRCVAQKDYYPWDDVVENYTIDDAEQLKEIAFNEEHLMGIDYIKEHISFGCDMVYYGGVIKDVDSMTLLD